MADLVVDVRLRIAGTRLAPTGAGLLILSEESLAPDEREHWERFWDGIREQCEVNGLTLMPNTYATLDALSAREYVESVDLMLGYLSS
jgi:hypothetical protein